MNVIKPHVSLNVTDIDASIAFYEKAFGVPPSKRRPGYAKFDLTSPMLNLTMQQAPVETSDTCASSGCCAPADLGNAAR